VLFRSDYIGTVYAEIKKWLKYRATSGPIGVTFSAGIDSGSVFLLAYHALIELGESPSRLKAFTLSIDDFVVTLFTIGNEGLETLSTYIYADARKGGLTPELRPLSAIIFISVLLLLLLIK